MSDDASGGPVEAAAALYEMTRSGERRVNVGDRAAVLHNHSLGSVALPSGELAACDPITSAYDAVAFERRVAAGTYPVEVCVAEFAEDQRVAAALVHLSSEEPSGWELSLWPGQDAAALDAGEFYGYPVDSGTGCFASPAALAQLAAILHRHFERSLGDADPLSAAMEATYVHTWSWANLAAGAGVNVVAFHSGYGDGIYPTCWGLDASGTPACALTDFLVIDFGEAGM